MTHDFSAVETESLASETWRRAEQVDDVTCELARRAAIAFAVCAAAIMLPLLGGVSVVEMFSYRFEWTAWNITLAAPSGIAMIFALAWWLAAVRRCLAYTMEMAARRRELERRISRRLRR